MFNRSYDVIGTGTSWFVCSQQSEAEAWKAD